MFSRVLLIEVKRLSVLSLPQCFSSTLHRVNPKSYLVMLIASLPVCIYFPVLRINSCILWPLKTMKKYFSFYFDLYHKVPDVSNNVFEYDKS